MATTLWQFSTTRMLEEYTDRLYLPAAGLDVPAAVTEHAVPTARASTAPLATEAG